MVRQRRSARQIASDYSGKKRNINQLWITVAIAVIALAAIVMFRHSCARRMGKFYESLNPPSKKEKLRPAPRTSNNNTAQPPGRTEPGPPSETRPAPPTP
jgi:hypothetical protein